MIVAPDGYILSIQGQYFTDHPNKDTSIFIDQRNINIDDLGNWI